MTEVASSQSASYPGQEQAYLKERKGHRSITCSWRPCCSQIFRKIYL